MIRLVAFDLDGVLIPSNASFDLFESRYGITRSDFSQFFRDYYEDAMVGKADFYDILRPALSVWKWNGGPEDFAAIWFASCSECESEGAEIVRSLRAKDVLCYVASNQDNRRADFLDALPWLQDLFHRRYFSCRMGVRKPHAPYFDVIQRESGVEPHEILFVDDKLENVEGARSCGWNAELCTGAGELRGIISRYFV